MRTITAELLFEAQNTLGEGPLWHPTQACLYWVDIEAGDLYQSQPGRQSFTKNHFDTPLGAYCFTAQGGFILATGDGFLAWEGDETQPSLMWNPLPGRAGVRLNDGKVDPAGRFWAGSMDTQQVKGELYRLDPDGGQHTLLHNIGISNGLGWSPDRKRMYYTDSLKRTIFTFDYELESGAISNPRPFVQLPDDGSDVVPDGLCVDDEGCVWSAQWHGWQVVRYDPQGNSLMAVSVPAQRVTSCCFGGDRWDQLFITTARTGLSEVELGDQPHAGDLFVVQTNTTGQVTNFFGGSR
ncbi:MAG: SMP-30/gluconolactonase/LRE family protein [Brevefilum sp.]|nr:SMP-30/gluconolactonase/LRE family protein [Brevefilum sp.]